MDTKTGEIASLEHFQKHFSEQYVKENIVPIMLKHLAKCKQNELQSTGRTFLGPRSRCACRSGKRFKSCCMVKA